MIEVGRLCLKIAGREAGKYCVIVKKMDESFVMVTGPKELTSVRRRRCNINHLEPIMEMLKIKSDAPDSDILKAYQEANLIAKLGLEARPEKKAEKPVEKKEKAPERKIEKRELKKEPKKSKPGKAVKKPAKKAEKKELKKVAKKSSAKKPAAKKAKK